MKKLLAITAAAAILAMAGAAMAADTTTVAVSATVTGVCKFATSGTISFSLDPSVATDATGTVTQPTLWCSKGTAYTIGDDNGVNHTATTYRVKDAASDYIPYSFTYTKTGTGSGKSTAIAMSIASKILNADYINQPAGLYTDTVTLTISP